MHADLERLQKAIAAATAGMTHAELTRRPEGKWSAAEILEHLYLTYTGTAKVFQRCLDAGKPLATRATLKQKAMTALVVECGYFPPRRQAPRYVVPRGTPAERVVAEISPQIAVMDELITRCESRFGARAKLLDHPVMGPLTARQWRRFHWVHGWHHVRQIRQRRKLEIDKPPA